MIPADWDFVSLEELATLKRGAFSVRPRNDPRYYGGQTPFVQTGDVVTARKFLQRYSQTLNEKGVAVSKVFPTGTILMTIAANIGDTAITTFPVACPDSLVGIEPKPERANTTWLKAVLETKQADLSDQAPQNAQKNINLEVLKPLQILVPPLAEQRRIALLLDSWDEGIALAEKLVAAKERRLDWLRSNVLSGGVRLNSFTSPWQTAPLSKFLTEHGETSTGREDVHSVSVHHGLINQIEHLGRSFAAANTDHYNRVLPGDIVYTKSPTGDFPLGIIKQSRLDKAAIVSPLYGVFTPASRELGTIMDTLFASPAAAERLLAPVVQKGAKNTIAVTNKNFLKAQLHLPTDQREIVALSELVEAARAELDVHQTELKLLRNQKRGLMQKLLTGQWRVPESIDALLPEALAT